MSTIGSDSFNEGGNTALNLHTPNVGATWTLEAAQFQVIGVTDRLQHNRNVIDRARKGDDIGDDDMDVSALCSVNGATSRVAGICMRMGTDGFANQYEAYLQFLNATTQQIFLYKNVGGVRTQIGNSPQNVTLAQNVQGLVKGQVRSGTQDVYVDGVLICSATEPDSTLSGRQYAGLLMNGNNSANATVDNFLSESVAAAADLSGTVTASSSLVGVLTTAILLAGLLTGTATVTADLTAGPVAVAESGGARDPLISPNRAPGQSPGWPGLSRLRSMRPLLESFVPVIADLSGEVTGTATVTGALTTGIPLDGTVTGTATVTADLTAGPELAATTQATATVTGTLTTQILLVAAVQGSAVVVGNLATGTSIPLAGAVMATATVSAVFAVPPSALSLLAPDRQDTWTPVWYFEGPAWPEVYSTRDVDIPGRQAYFRILNKPSITRRLVDVAAFGTSVEVQDVTVELANPDGALSGDYRGAAFTLTAYDPLSGFLLEAGTFIVSSNPRNRGTVTIEGTSLDPGIPEDPIPKGVIDVATTPRAVDIGLSDNWLFGNHVNVPLRYVDDNVIESEFTYRVCRGTAAAITAMRRVTPNGVTPFVTLGTAPDYLDGYIELEPAPGMAGVLKNGNLENWSTAAIPQPEFWTVSGAGATVVKNTTPGQFDEGGASAMLTRVGFNCVLYQDLMLNAPWLPLSWWRGRESTLNVMVRTNIATRAFIRIDDGIGFTDSAYHSGGSTFELRAASRVLDAAATKCSIELWIFNGDAAAQFDDVQVFLKAKSWHEVRREELYPGYTAVRLYLRQEDASGALHQVVADVHGLQPERNPVRMARTMLSDVTHGLGKTVDAASFDQAEIDIAADYHSLIIVDAPKVLLDFNDSWGTPAYGAVVARDDSGHEHPGTYFSATGAPVTTGGFSGTLGDLVLNVVNVGSFVTIPYSADFDPVGGVLGLEIWYKPSSIQAGAAIAPICEKLVGAAFKSGLCLYQTNSTIVAAVNASGGLVTVAITLAAGDIGTSPMPFDGKPYLHCMARAANGMLTLTVGRAGVLTTATVAYTGTLPSGEGDILIGKFGTGQAGNANGAFDKFALYTSEIPDAQVAVHATGEAYPQRTLTTVGIHQAAFFPQGVSVLPTLAYFLDEASGATMTDWSGNGTHGTYVGGPTLAVLGPAPFNDGYFNRAVSFENDLAKYARADPGPLSGTALTVNVWCKLDAASANSGLVEKTTDVNDNLNSGWSLFQEGAAMYFRVKEDVSGVLRTLSFPVTPEDVGRYMLASAVFYNGTMKLYRNGLLKATGDYTSPVRTGGGQLYVGSLGLSAGTLINYPCQGDLAVLTIHSGVAFSDADIASVYTSGTWYPGGLLIDAALTEPRQAQDILKQVAQLRGLRFGFTATGGITCTVDATAPTTILMEARDGAGDGECTLLDCRDRQRPALKDAVRDLIVNYRRDPLSSTYLRQLVRPISTALDAQGNRIGVDRIINLDVVREDPSADRFACYMAALLSLDETVAVTLGPEARALREGMLVRLTDAHMGYLDDVLVVKEVTHVYAEESEAVLKEWDESIYVYSPGAFPVGAGPG